MTARRTRLSSFFPEPDQGGAGRGLSIIETNMLSSYFNFFKINGKGMSSKQGRNELCLCGSGKKFKKCCGFQEMVDRQRTASVLKFSPFARGLGASTAGFANRVFKVVSGQNEEARQALAGKHVAVQTGGEGAAQNLLKTS
jgi:hypothetical protein